MKVRCRFGVVAAAAALRTRLTDASTLRRALVVMVTASAVAITTSCSSTAVDEPEPWDLGPFSEMVQGYAVEAASGGASEQQLAVLGKAAEAGELTLEDARAATRATIECFEASGLEAEYVEAPDSKGFVIPAFEVSYGAEADVTQADSTIEMCQNREFTWVGKAYQLQPDARQMLGEYVTSKEEVLRACLEDAGQQPDPRSTAWDLAQQSVDVVISSEGSIDCLGAAGISSL